MDETEDPIMKLGGGKISMATAVVMAMYTPINPQSAYVKYCHTKPLARIELSTCEVMREMIDQWWGTMALSDEERDADRKLYQHEQECDVCKAKLVMYRLGAE